MEHLGEPMAVPAPGLAPVAKQGVTMDNVFKLMEAPTSKIVALRDLPRFSGQSHEDATDSC